MICSLYLINRTSYHISVERSDILMGVVHLGDVDIEIAAYGLLLSAKRQWVSADIYPKVGVSIVKEIVVKAGQRVDEDSVIVRLENIELRQLLLNVRYQYNQSKANLKHQKLVQNREILDDEMLTTELLTQYEMAKLNRVSEEILVKQGITAKNTYQQSLLLERQYKLQSEVQQQRHLQLINIHSASVEILQNTLNQHQKIVYLAEARVDKLLVRAGMQGVVQQLSVELGESLQAGQKISLIGSLQELVALVQVPQSQASQIAVGQKAVLEISGTSMDAHVMRLDPGVENNSVKIELELAENYPKNARPQASVEARVLVGRLKQAYYLEKPSSIVENELTDVYKVNKDMHSAQLTQVQFGRRAGRFIEIISGLNAGDSVILSDLNDLELVAETLIIN